MLLELQQKAHYGVDNEFMRKIQQQSGKRALKMQEKQSQLELRRQQYKLYGEIDDYVSQNGYLPQKLLSRRFKQVDTNFKILYGRPNLPVKRRMVVNKKLEQMVDDIAEITRLKRPLLFDDKTNKKLLYNVYGMEEYKLVNLPFQKGIADNALEAMDKQITMEKMLNALGNRIVQDFDEVDIKKIRDMIQEEEKDGVFNPEITQEMRDAVQQADNPGNRMNYQQPENKQYEPVKVPDMDFYSEVNRQSTQLDYMVEEQKNADKAQALKGKGKRKNELYEEEEKAVPPESFEQQMQRIRQEEINQSMTKGGLMDTLASGTTRVVQALKGFFSNTIANEQDIRQPVQQQVPAMQRSEPTEMIQARNQQQAIQQINPSEFVQSIDSAQDKGSLVNQGSAPEQQQQNLDGLLAQAQQNQSTVAQNQQSQQQQVNQQTKNLQQQEENYIIQQYARSEGSSVQPKGQIQLNEIQKQQQDSMDYFMTGEGNPYIQINYNKIQSLPFENQSDVSPEQIESQLKQYYISPAYKVLFTTTNPDTIANVLNDKKKLIPSITNITSTFQNNLNTINKTVNPVKNYIFSQEMGQYMEKVINLYRKFNDSPIEDPSQIFQFINQYDQYFNDEYGTIVKQFLKKGFSQSPHLQVMPVDHMKKYSSDMNVNEVFDMVANISKKSNPNLNQRAQELAFEADDYQTMRGLLLQKGQEYQSRLGEKINELQLKQDNKKQQQEEEKKASEPEEGTLEQFYNQSNSNSVAMPDSSIQTRSKRNKSAAPKKVEFEEDKNQSSKNESSMLSSVQDSSSNSMVLRSRTINKENKKAVKQLAEQIIQEEYKSSDDNAEGTNQSSTDVKAISSQTVENIFSKGENFMQYFRDISFQNKRPEEYTPQDVQKRMLKSIANNNDFDLTDVEPATIKGMLQYLSDNDESVQEYINPKTFNQIAAGVSGLTNAIPSIQKVHKALKNNKNVSSGDLSKAADIINKTFIDIRTGEKSKTGKTQTTQVNTYVKSIQEAYTNIQNAPIDKDKKSRLLDSLTRKSFVIAKLYTDTNKKMAEIQDMLDKKGGNKALPAIAEEVKQKSNKVVQQLAIVQDNINTSQRTLRSSTVDQRKKK